MVSLLQNSGSVSNSSRFVLMLTVGCTPPAATAAALGRSSSCTVQAAEPTRLPNSLF
jgi:hypothetical protein